MPHEITKGEKGMPSRNKFFSNDKRAKGLDQGGIATKEPCDAIPDTGSHDTSPERGENAMKEDKGA